MVWVLTPVLPSYGLKQQDTVGGKGLFKYHVISQVEEGSLKSSFLITKGDHAILEQPIIVLQKKTVENYSNWKNSFH